jgi:hypothetical protein
MSRRKEQTPVTHTVELSCRHVLIFAYPPVTGETIWCHWCSSEQKVVQAPAEFRVKCRDCRANGRFGRARITAEIFACKHRRKQSGHTVDLFDGLKIVFTFGHRDGQLSFGDSAERVTALDEYPF